MAVRNEGTKSRRYTPAVTWLSDRLDARAGGSAQRYRSEIEYFDSHGLREARASLLSDLEGDILEIGCGIGSNFDFYAPGARVTAIEPYEPYRAYARQKAEALAGAGKRIDVVSASVLELPFADSSFDAVVSTLVFCSVSDPPTGLKEIFRVAKPGATVRFLEHVRSFNWLGRFLQIVANPIAQQTDPNGCSLLRPTIQTDRQAGFCFEEPTRVRLTTITRWLFPIYAMDTKAVKLSDN